MCKSLAEGGQRCAAHAHERLMGAAKHVTHAAEAGDRDRYEAARMAWEQAAVEYASTPAGAAALEKQQAHAAETGDTHGAGMLGSILRRGAMLREANQQVKATINLIHTMQTLPAHEEEVVGAEPAVDLNGNPFTAEEQAVWDTTMRALAARRADAIARFGRPDGQDGRPHRFDAVVALDAAVADPSTDDITLARHVSAAFGGSREARVPLLDALSRRVLSHPRTGVSTWEEMSRHSDINDTLGLDAIHGAAISRLMSRIRGASVQDYQAPDAHWGSSNVTLALDDVSDATWSSLHTKSTSGDLHASLACLASPRSRHREDALMAISACDYDQMSVYEVGQVLSATEKSRPCPEFTDSMRTTMRTSIHAYAESLDPHGNSETIQRREELTRLLEHSEQRESQWVPPEKRTAPGGARHSRW